MDDRDRFDPLVDAALASYGEPREGLENRVFAALNAERRVSALKPQTQRWRWLGWAIATPIAAALLLLTSTVWHMPKHATPHGTPDSSASAVPHSITVPRSPDLRAKPTHEQRVSAARTAQHRLPAPQRLPKLDIFPTPQPLTPSERALAEYVASASPEERQAIIDAQQKQDQPIHIAAIEIAPLESDSSHGN